MSITKMPQPAYFAIAETYNEDYQINPYAVPVGKFYDLDEAKAWAMRQFQESESAARWKIEHGEGLTRGWVIREDDFNNGRYENRFPIEYPDWWTDEFRKFFKD